MIIIEIGNININNEHMITNILSNAGYAASLKQVNDTTATIDLGSEEHRDSCGIRVVDIERMFSLLILAGFSLRKLND